MFRATRKPAQKQREKGTSVDDSSVGGWRLRERNCTGKKAESRGINRHATPADLSAQLRRSEINRLKIDERCETLDIFLGGNSFHVLSLNRKNLSIISPLLQIISSPPFRLFTKFPRQRLITPPPPPPPFFFARASSDKRTCDCDEEYIVAEAIASQLSQENKRRLSNERF